MIGRRTASSSSAAAALAFRKRLAVVNSVFAKTKTTVATTAADRHPRLPLPLPLPSGQRRDIYCSTTTAVSKAASPSFSTSSPYNRYWNGIGNEKLAPRERSLRAAPSSRHHPFTTSAKTSLAHDHDGRRGPDAAATPTHTPTAVPNSNSNSDSDTTIPAIMASDDDYMAFLNKANADPNAGIAAEAKKGKEHEELRTTDDGAAVPAAIRDAVRGAFYVSDADEPFVPVCLQLPSSTGEEEGGGEREGLPDEGMCFLGFGFCDYFMFSLFTFFFFFLTFLEDGRHVYLPVYLFTLPSPLPYSHRDRGRYQCLRTTHALFLLSNPPPPPLSTPYTSNPPNEQ